LRFDLCEIELVLQFDGGIRRETKIGAGKFLIDHGSAEKIAELLLFDRIARSGENVAPTGVHGAGDLPVEWSEKGEGAIFKLDFGVTTAEFNARTGLNFVDGGGIGQHAVEGSQDFARFARRSLLRRGAGSENRNDRRKDEGPGIHAGSVVR
jgi:hypothetical protein